MSPAFPQTTEQKHLCMHTHTNTHTTHTHTTHTHTHTLTHTLHTHTLHTHTLHTHTHTYIHTHSTLCINTAQEDHLYNSRIDLNPITLLLMKLWNLATNTYMAT